MARKTRATTQTAPARKSLDIPLYLTVEELATVLHQRPRTIRYWINTSYGPIHTKMGRSIRFPKDEVEMFCADPAGYQARRTGKATNR